MKKSLLWITVLAVGLTFLVGCDGGYALLVENCSDQTITVEWDYKPASLWTLKPCTGRARIWELGPPGNPGWDLVVWDAWGTRLAEETIEATSNDARPKTIWYLYHYAPKLGVCQEPVEGYYRILVRNESAQVKDAVLGDWYSGPLVPGEEAEIMRVGNIAEAAVLWPKTLDGENISGSLFERSVPDYRIGEVPTLVITLY